MSEGKRPWSRYERLFVLYCYTHATTKAMAVHLGRTPSSVYQQGLKMGLRKSPELKYHCSAVMGRKNGTRYGFQKGRETWNKGKEHRPPGSESGWFHKGNVPHTWKPVGAERKGADGYLYRKVSDTRCKERDWRLAHVLLWEQHHGPVPDGRIVVFKNRNQDDIRIDNLECITRAENMKRNQYQRYPEPIAKAIQLRGALNRQINQRART